MTFVEQLDEQLIQLYFKEGIKVVRERWLIGQKCKLYLKLGQGIEYEGEWRCSTSDTKRTREDNTTG